MRKSFSFLLGAFAMLLIGTSCGEDTPVVPAVAPDFTVKTTTDVTADPATGVPTKLTVPGKAMSLVIEVVSSHSSELKSATTLPEGWTITSKPETTNADKKVVQEYTITTTKNGTTELTHEFVLVNKQDVTKMRKFTLVQLANRPLLPLDYVAEYNVNKEGTALLTTHDGEENSKHLFSFAEAQKVSVAGYHVPSLKELTGIIPMQSLIQFNAPMKEELDNTQDVEVGGVELKCLGDYICLREDGNEAFALRFKDNAGNMRSAWKYEYVASPQGEGKVLKITCRYLGTAEPALTVQDIAKEEYWSKNATEDVFCILAAGGAVRWGSLGDVGKEGFFWSSTPEGDYAYRTQFSERNAQTAQSWNIQQQYSVRLFKNAK